MNLSFKEFIILLIVIAVIVTIIISVIKASVKLLVVGVVLFGLFSGFTWLPEKVAEWTNTDIVQKDPNKEFQDVVQNGVDYIDENKDSWIAAAHSLWAKITGEDKVK